MGSEDSGKKGEKKPWGELTVAALVILIVGWLLNQNSKLYDEISKLKEKNESLNSRVLVLEQKNFILRSEIPQLTIAKDDWGRLTSTFASKEDLAQTDIRMKAMIYQLNVWAQEDFAEICEAVQGVPTSDNICKLNGSQRQIVFKPMNLEFKK